MKKILTLKLIVVFIITFLFYKYNVLTTHAATTINCTSILIDVDDSRGNYIPDIDIALTKAPATPFTLTTNASGKATQTFASLTEIVTQIAIPNQSGYTGTTATLSAGLTPNQCVAVVHLVSSTAPPPVTCYFGIRGTVVDTSGNGISVAIVNVTTTSLLHETITNSAGEWVIPDNSLTVTGITIRATGYQTVTLPPQCNTGIIELTSTTTTTTPTTTTLPTAIVPETLMGKIQNLAIAIGAIIAIIRIILGGLKLSGSGDNPIALEEGRDMITSSILGLLVILFAVTLLRVIGSSVLGIIK